MTDSLSREIRTLRALHESDRDPDGRAFAPLADALRRSGDIREALKLLGRGLEQHPDFSSGHVVAARTYLDAGMIAEAELSARRVLELDGENVEGLRVLALAQQARGDDPGARRTRRRMDELGDGAAAREEAVELAALAPDEPEEEPDSEETMELAALAPDEPEEEPDSEETVELAALAPDEPEEEPDSEETVELSALAPDEPEREPDSEETVELAALAPDEPEEKPDSEETMELAALAPDEPEGGEAEEPEAVARDDDVLDPHEPLPTRTLADLYARQGLTERALSVYRQLLEVTPGDQTLQERILALEEGDGEAVPASRSETTPEPPPPPSRAAASDIEGEDEQGEDDRVASAIGWGPSDRQEEEIRDTPFAWTRGEEATQPGASGPTIGAYFQRMLSWGTDAEDEDRAVGDER